MQQHGVNTKAFYRPELDVLRFVAFVSVFAFHGFGSGLRQPGGPIPSVLEHNFVGVFNLLVRSGAYGLCLFFLLSSYLITELLLRERERTGSVHLKAFYIRRIIRIWPLYYLGIAVGIAFAFARPEDFWIPRKALLCLVFLVGWFIKSIPNPIGPLWSISVEECFYLVWPSVTKFGGAIFIAVASAIIVPIALFECVHTSGDWWYNPITQFLFFATGAFLALALRRWNYSVHPAARIPLFLAGLFAWAAVPSGRLHLPPAPLHMLWMLLPDLGCVLIFLAFFGCPVKFLPRSLIYLGQISYGLYVFHLCCLMVAARIVAWLPGSEHQSVRVSLTALLALSSAIAIASLSYRYYEKPFLRLKKRFTFIPSRDS